ncbi:ImmA/IrrE family metallo-endopeptidase [Enterococcus hirae]|uniref:ImmA/IrrE family metallo-endopeptidase n=1 Tax=Enterococcus hirae TaxID=1354 RepID=UPI001618A031|nr:ImmA/IrrE family metallo-endopeptidase [Enterococcus hirae]
MDKTISQFYDSDFIIKFESHATVLYEVNFDETKPEIDVKEIANKLGFNIKYVFMEKSGKLEDGIIKVNLLDHEVRQRFTIAHEIGHFLLHDPNEVMYRDVSLQRYKSIVERIKEREANGFAAELLMPKRLLIKLINEYLEENNWDSLLDDIQFETLLKDISKKLNVSKSSLEFRLQNLGVIKGE